MDEYECLAFHAEYMLINTLRTQKYRREIWEHNMRKLIANLRDKSRTYRPPLEL